MGLCSVKDFSCSHHVNRLVFFALWSLVNCSLGANTGANGIEWKAEGINEKPVTACNISRVENYSDSCMCTLTEVLCNNMELRRVPTKIMPMVEILSLSHNSITKINDNDFLGIEYLKVLYLQNNEISSIDPAAFRNFYRLQTLNLANNKLGRLDIAGGVLFQRLLSISRIDLQNSEITQLNKLSFMRIVMSKNVEILLGGNKITCDCNVLAIRKWRNYFTPNGVKFTDLVCHNDPFNRTYDQFDTSLINCSGNGSLALTSPAGTFSTNKHTVDTGNNMEMETPMEQDNKHKLNDAYNVNNIDGVDTSEIRYPLSPVEYSDGKDEIFPSRPYCDQCTNVSTNSRCTGYVQCAAAQSMCYSDLTWDPVKRNMTINKGCLTVNECYQREERNRQYCSVDYLNNKTIQCSFCCIGLTCGDGTLGGRLENDLKYFITFVRNQPYQDYMNNSLSQDFIREQALIADGIKRLFTDIQGGMDIATLYRPAENKNQHRIILNITLTILSTVAPEQVLSILNEDLEKAKSDQHGFLITQDIIPSSLYIGVEKNIMCDEDTTSSDKGNITWPANHTGVFSILCPYDSSANASRACLTENSFTFWGPVDDTNCSTLPPNWTPNQTSAPLTNLITTSCTAPNCAIKIPTATNCTATTCIEINSTTENSTTSNSATTTPQPTGSPEGTEQTASTESPGTDVTTTTRQTVETQGPGTETSTESHGTGPSLQTPAINNSSTAGNSGPTLDSGLTGQTPCAGLPGQTKCGGIPGQTITPAPTNMTVTNEPSSDNASQSSKELLSEIQNTRNFTPEILDKFISTLEFLVERESLEKAGVVGNVMDSIDSLLQVNDTLLKMSDEKTKTSERLLKVIEYLPERAPMMNGTLMVVKPNLAVAAIAIDKNETQNIMLVVITEPGQNLTESEVQLGFQGNSSGATTMTIPSNALIQSLETDQQENLTRVSFTVFQSDKLFSTMHASVLAAAKINSNVISASIPGIKVQNLSENITMSFQHENINSTNPKCVFWKSTLETTHGGWSDEGCVVIEANNLSTTCGCTHLTNFALLMDVYQEGSNLSELDRKILSVISYVGCAISFCALLLTLLTYSCFRKLRRDNPSKILINLCLALLSSNLVFLIGMQDYTFENSSSCKAVAVLLHYFLLASMTWMAVEAFYMYLALILVFKTYFTNFILKCSLVGWGVPLLIVIITLAVNSSDNYGFLNSGLCWIYNPAFYGAFVGPVCFILLINCMAFCLVVKRLMGMSSTKLNKTDRNNTVHRLRGAVGVVILLGLTWIFAIFAIDQASVAFYYLFTIFNSLQGLFIFIFYCLLKKDAMTVWKRMLPCSEEFGEQSKYSSNSKASTAHHNVVNKSRHSVATLNGTTTTSTSPDSRKNSYFSTVNSNNLYNSYEEKEFMYTNTDSGNVPFTTLPRPSLSPQHLQNNGFPADNYHDKQGFNNVYVGDPTEGSGIPKVNNLCVDPYDDISKQVHNYLKFAPEHDESPIKEFREVSHQSAEYYVPEERHSPSMEKREKAEGEIDTSPLAKVQDIKLKFERTVSETKI